MEIKMKPLQIEGFRALVMARAIKHIHVESVGGGFLVTVNHQFQICNRQNKKRYFKKFATVISWLRECGYNTIHHVDL